jgi:hypothetical protein
MSTVLILARFILIKRIILAPHTHHILTALLTLTAV